jgi:hypothetical protein
MNVIRKISIAVTMITVISEKRTEKLLQKTEQEYWWSSERSGPTHTKFQRSKTRVNFHWKKLRPLLHRKTEWVSAWRKRWDTREKKRRYGGDGYEQRGKEQEGRGRGAAMPKWRPRVVDVTNVNIWIRITIFFCFNYRNLCGRGRFYLILASPVQTAMSHQCWWLFENCMKENIAKKALQCTCKYML